MLCQLHVCGSHEQYFSSHSRNGEYVFACKTNTFLVTKKCAGSKVMVFEMTAVQLAESPQCSQGINRLLLGMQMDGALTGRLASRYSATGQTNRLK